MASEQSFEDLSLEQKHNFSPPTISTEENTDGCFDCNICLDSALEPVVTLCGHLYCWPCIYEWLHVQTSSPDPKQNCPVCKATISHTSLVPLYGRGVPSDSKSKKPRLELAIPRRPLPSRANAMVHHQEFYGGYAAAAAEEASPRDVAGVVTSSVFNPYGEMIYARIFGSSDPGLFAYPQQTNSYPFVGNSSSSPRMRRQEMELDKSLNRVSIFLFCCFVLCLLTF